MRSLEHTKYRGVAATIVKQATATQSCKAANPKEKKKPKIRILILKDMHKYELKSSLLFVLISMSVTLPTIGLYINIFYLSIFVTTKNTPKHRYR